MRDTIDMMRDACDKDKVDAWQNGFWTITQEELKAFEALVRADERNKVWSQKHWTEYEQAIVAAEREACAKVCNEVEASPEYKAVANLCAAAIRARGNT